MINMLLMIVGLAASAVAVGTIVYLTYKLTIAVLKSYKKKKTSKLIAARIKDLINEAPSISLGELDGDDVILAEYDLEEDNLVQDVSFANDIDDNVSDIINSNGGIVVFE